MIFKLIYIVRLVLAVLLPLLFALAPATAQTVVQQGTTTTLSVIAVPGCVYEWDIYNTGTVNFANTPGNCPVTSAAFTGGSKGSTVDVRWLQPGNYFYKVTATDALGCAVNFKIGKLTVASGSNLKAVISGSNLTGYCQKVILEGSKSTGNIVSYQWSSTDQGVTLSKSTGNTTDFQFSSSNTGPLPSDFRVQLKVSDNNGNTSTDLITITVDSRPVAKVYTSGITETDGTMLADGTVSTGKLLQYKWSTFNGKIIGPDNEPTARMSGNGEYELKITDRYGCKATKSIDYFPLEINQIEANNDQANITWPNDTTIQVLANDWSTVKLIPGSVHVKKEPGRGTTKVNPDGSIIYTPGKNHRGREQFDYEVCDEKNFCASATVTIDIVDIGLTIPEGFSPNGDGINEKLVIRGLGNYPGSQLYVFTSAGQMVYQSLDFKSDWNGVAMKGSATIRGLVPTGTYYYILKVGGINRTVKGFIYIGY